MSKSYYLVLWALLAGSVPPVFSIIINFDPYEKAHDIDNGVFKTVKKFTCDENSETLNLSGMDIRELKHGIVKSSSITSISLENNHIIEIPWDYFKDTPNLRCLNLAYNELPLSQLYKFAHDKLDTLIFDKQLNVQFDNMIFDENVRSNFSNLQTLSLNENAYEGSMFYLTLFPKLVTIYWVNSSISYVAPDIFDTLGPSLKNVHLEQNNLSYLRLDSLGNVEALYLDENPLQELFLPRAIGFKTLSLANCNLLEAWGLDTSSLITLNLSGNWIETIELDKLSVMPNLENLSLSRNRLKTFPSLKQFTRLRRLSLSYNLIDALTDVSISDSLKALSLRGNGISIVRESALSELTNLEELDLSENKLHFLPPNWAESLKMLRRLNLNSNKFSAIADMRIFSLINLRNVFIAENPVVTIDSNNIANLSDNCILHVI